MIKQKQFKSLFEEFYPDLVRMAFFYVHESSVAEDIVQEIFVRLWEKQVNLSSIENLKGYLQYAVKNRSLNYLEHLQVMDKYQQEYIHQLRQDDSAVEDYIRLVQKLVGQLPEKRRQVLEMSVIESKSYQEISEELKISVNTVKDHIKKAYAFLRERAAREIPHYILFLSFLRKE